MGCWLAVLLITTRGHFSRFFIKKIHKIFTYCCGEFSQEVNYGINLCSDSHPWSLGHHRESWWKWRSTVGFPAKDTAPATKTWTIGGPQGTWCTHWWELFPIEKCWVKILRCCIGCGSAGLLLLVWKVSWHWPMGTLLLNRQSLLMQRQLTWRSLLWPHTCYRLVTPDGDPS